MKTTCSQASVRRREAGFTLVELTLSAGLMAIILGSAYACLNAGVAAQRLMEPRIEAAQSARVALALLTADLRAACPLDRQTEFIGMDRKIGAHEADNIDFGTLNQTPSRPGDGDFCQTSYYLERDPEAAADTFILWRRRNPRIGLDPFQGGQRQEIARGVRELKFEFYDGFDWYETWGDPDRRGKRETSNRLEPNLSGMPEAVRVTLSFATDRPRKRSDEGLGESTSDATKPEPPMVFQTVARLNVPAWTYNRGGSGGAPGTGNTPTPGEGTPNASGVPFGPGGPVFQ